MRDAPRVVIDRFESDPPDVSTFASGNRVLDAWLHQQWERDELGHTAVTYVLIDAADSAPRRRVIGYFTLNSFAFPKSQARRRDRDKHVDRYDPVPAVLIGRLAVDAEYQGVGLGSTLLVAALVQMLAVRDRLGIAVAVVHAIDDAAAAFYEHQGFTRFRDNPHHLYYPLATFERALEQHAQALPE